MVKASAEATYDRFAPIYDEWNAQNDYEMWLGEALLPALEMHGLRKGWALDVGCGTGRAFLPLLARGWRVIGCDVSAGMLAEAGQSASTIGTASAPLDSEERDFCEVHLSSVVEITCLLKSSLSLFKRIVQGSGVF